MRVRISATLVAYFALATGWTCVDGMTQRHLTNTCTPQPETTEPEAAALALCQKEYPDAAAEPEPQPVASDAAAEQPAPVVDEQDIPRKTRR